MPLLLSLRNCLIREDMKVEKANWDKKTLGEVSVFKRGLTYPKIEECTYETSNIVLRSNNVDLITHSLILDELKYLSEEYKIPNDKKIAKNTILMCMSNGSATHIGKVAFIDKDYNYAFGGFMGLIMPKNINPKFLYYKYRSDSFKSFLGKIGNGINITNLKFSAISSLPILVPNPSIQQAIASELDAIQEVIDGYKAQLADLDVLAQSIFLDTFGDPVSNPKGWGKKTLNEVCSKITDGTHDTPKRLTDGIKFITGKHIRPFFIDYDHSDYVSENVHKEIYARCNPQKGDVLYTNIGSGVGTAAVNTVDYEFSMKNVALLKPSKELNGIYLQFVLNDIHFKSVVLPTYLAGGAQSFLSLKQIKSMPIPLPDFVHQQQFAEQVEAIEKQKDLLREQLKDAETLMAERMQYYFS